MHYQIFITGLRKGFLALRANSAVEMCNIAGRFC